MYPRALSELIRALSGLPGIGPKTAERLAVFLAHSPEQQVARLKTALERLKGQVFVCTDCGTLSENTRCVICADASRDHQLVCVVESPADLAALEAAGSYQGVYHVLGGSLSPLDGAGPLSLKIEKLRERIAAGQIKEVLLATNPTVEGEATANLLSRALAADNIKLTRLAYGMPVGGNLQYMDALTLSRSLAGRTPLN